MSLLDYSPVVCYLCGSVVALFHAVLPSRSRPLSFSSSTATHARPSSVLTSARDSSKPPPPPEMTSSTGGPVSRRRGSGAIWARGLFAEIWDAGVQPWTKSMMATTIRKSRWTFVDHDFAAISAGSSIFLSVSLPQWASVRPSVRPCALCIAIDSEID